MGQVPPNRFYGIVGDGRVATHITHYFRELGIPFEQWSRRISGEFCESLSDRLGACDTILVLLKDSAIVPFIEANPRFFKHKKAIHFSGALVTDLAEGTHPLMTFGPHLYSLEDYREIPFVCEKGKTPFEEVFPALKNPHFAIEPEGKGLYHSLCVMSGNFSSLLWQKFFGEMKERFNIPKEVLRPYLLQTMNNLLDDEATAVTGPIQRRDHGTLRTNLKALEKDSYQKIFRAFVDAHVPEYTDFERRGA